VTYERGAPRWHPPPPPISSAPVGTLLPRVDELAKAWLLALLEQRQFEDAPAILAAELVRDGPRLCAAVLGALADDRELRQLEHGGAHEQLASRAGELAGASEAEPSARAVDALWGVIWSAMRAQLDRPGADEVGALAERLALVTDLVRAAVMRRFASGAGSAVDVGADVSEAVGPGIATGAMEVGAEASGEVIAWPRAPQHSPVPNNGLPPAPLAAESQLTAESLWRDALEDEVARAQRSGAKLALLLAELGEADHVSASAPAHVASEAFGRFAQAVRSALRREDILACETESRAWVIARTTGRAGARALGSRIAHAVQEAEPWRAAPLTVGIGIAILGEDAHDAAGLISAAGDWTFAAVSAGAVAADAPGPPGEDGPAGDGGPPLAG
jgi:GGDEF domain-containing protein